jgi:hypothetical protein
MNNVAPLQGMAENLAQHGRYGDSMLVHMNPIEVQGIASLMPNGQLPLNPVTGQPEAFAFLAPLLGGFLGKALLANTLGNAALASALGSGVLTAAVEKDLGKGLAAGLMSFAGSKILGAGQQAGVQESIQEGLGQSGIDAASLQLQNVGGEQVLKHLVEDETGKTVAQQLTEQQINKLGAGGEQGLIDLMQQSSTLPEVAAGTTNPFAAAGAEFMNPRTALPFAIGASEYVRKDLDSSLIDEESDDDLMLAEQGIDNAMRQRIYDYGFPAQGIAPRDPRFAPNQIMAAGGGLVSLNPAQYADKKNGLARLMGEPVRMQIGGSLPDLGQYQGYSLQPSASEAQSGLRGTQAISAPQMQALTASGYRAGFDPELQYFRTPDRFGNDPFPEVFDPRNPNAPVLPTDAQLAQELAEAEASGAGAGTADSTALYGMPGYVSPDGAYSRFLGGTLGSGIAGVPTMGQNYDTNQGIAALQGLDYSDYPKRSDFGSADEGGHLEYQQAQQEWFRNRMPSARTDQPVMPSEATSPVVPIPPPASPTSRAEQLQYQIDMLTKGTRGPNAEEQARADQLQAELDAMRQASPLMPPPVVGRPTEPPPPVEQPPVSNEKLQRILADRPRRGEYDSPYDFITDLRDFRGINPFNKGGLVKMQDMGQVPEMLIDPALEDPAMADPMANIDPETQQLLEQAAMAILGQVSPEEADAIIQAFIERFGPEVFQQFRNQVLTAVVPNAQTEGMVEGQGDGMSDEIMGMIGDQQQVAVSPGEYIVPADVVSGIGNGSSDAGANELDRMLADIRQARTGMTEQPPEIDPRGAMPA